MKKLYSLFVFASTLIACNLYGQDIPLFSQKLTNSFIYNPAVAGQNVGSVTYSFRQTYGGIPNAPKNNFISVHTPISDNKFGIGANFYQEEVNFLKNSYASVAFAYHLRFDKVNSLSFGVSGEYNFLRLSGTSNSTLEDPDYINLANGQLNDYDFSFGMLYQSRYFKAGAAANRLATAWVKKDKDFILSSFYSGFIQGMIPMRGGEDMLEPYVAFRQFSETNSTYDIGLYYTYNNLIMAGAAVRQGSVASLTTSFRINKKFLIGYSHEIILGDIRSQVGSTNEFTLRFDFNEYDYKANFRTDYRNSLAYRRKTLPIAKPVKTPAQFHKNQKKSKAYSPNKRYQQTRKHKVQPSSNRKLKVAKTRRHAKVYNPMRR